MTHPRGPIPAVTAVLAAMAAFAMMVAMAGCSAESDDEPTDDVPNSQTGDVSNSPTDDTTGTDDANPSDDAMVDALRRSKRAFLDSAIGLGAAGYSPTFGYTHYAICADESAYWRVSANGRLDRQRPIGSTRADAESIRDELTSAGWTAYDTATSPEGIREFASHWIVTVEWDDLTINVSLYTDQPFILMRVLGPCLPATPAQRQEYESAADQRFAVPRASDDT
jgi:hypothetical protein